MRVVVQRVQKASVKEKGALKARIGRGLLLYVAIGQGDEAGQIQAMAEKIAKLRLFPEEGKLHDFQLSVREIKGEILSIPNFTLYGDLSQSNRPYFGRADSPTQAKPKYEDFLEQLQVRVGDEVSVKSATFGELMVVEVVNDGPANIILGVSA